jgi:hypothetical protein
MVVVVKEAEVPDASASIQRVTTDTAAADVRPFVISVTPA